MRTESIYYVFNPLGNTPKVIHNTLESAREEARRLAATHPTVEFFVVRAIESIKYRTDPFVVVNYSKKEK